MAKRRPQLPEDPGQLGGVVAELEAERYGATDLDQVLGELQRERFNNRRRGTRWPNKKP